MDPDLFAIHRELDTRHWWFRGRRTALLALGQRLMPTRGTVVDLGCGTGADIAAFPPVHVRIGIDRSEDAIRLARERYPDVRFRVGVLPTDAQDAVRSADLLLLCDVIEHVADDRGLVAGIVAAMRPSAYLLVTAPADPRLWSPHDEVYGHFRRYDRDSLAATWKDLGVACLLLAPFNRRLYPLAMLSRLFTRRVPGRKSSDLRLPWKPLNTLLEAIFSSESPALVRAIERGRPELPGRGVSLLAVLRRTSGDANSVSPSPGEGDD